MKFKGIVKFFLSSLLICFVSMYKLTNFLDYADIFDELQGFSLLKTNSKYDNIVKNNIAAYAFMQDLSLIIKLNEYCNKECKEYMEYLRGTNFEEFVTVINGKNIQRNYTIDIDNFFY